ncbi:DNA primase, partial [Candidatus Aerophobetes bacterium]|nr:DNA primase [Candidatus Aerophobetes bacterium]
RESLYRIMQEVAEFFHRELENNLSVKKYLQERGFQPSSISAFKLGWAPSSEIFLNFCRKKGFSPERLKELGLVKSRPEDGELYAYFRHRIIFPIFSLSGRVIGFGARVIDESLPKYINSPQSVLFDKGKNLYGLHLALREIRKKREAILVEGYTDVIALHQEGITNTVASLGTSLTTGQAWILKRYADTVFLAYDEDSAGEMATLRGIDLLLESGLQVKIIELPPGKDPADMVKEEGVKRFLEAKDRALFYIDYRLKVATKKKPLSLEEKIKQVNSLFSTLRKVNSLYIRDESFKKISQAFGFSEESLRAEFKKFCSENENSFFSNSLKVDLPKEEDIEKKLLQIMLHYPQSREIVRKEISVEDFSSPLCRRLAEEILSLKEEELTPSCLINRFADTSLCSLVSSLSFVDSSFEGFDPCRITMDVIRTLKRRIYQRKISQLRREAENYERQGEEEKARKIWQQLVQLQKSILK